LRYGALVEGVTVVCLEGVHPVTDRSVALRLVVLADRLYDRDVPVLASGVPLDQLFPAELLSGGYRKKVPARHQSADCARPSGAAPLTRTAGRARLLPERPVLVRQPAQGRQNGPVHEHSDWRWTPPPGWPDPPKGWMPTVGWQPTPDWPPAPLRWRFWQRTPEAKARRQSLHRSLCAYFLVVLVVASASAALVPDHPVAGATVLGALLFGAALSAGVASVRLTSWRVLCAIVFSATLAATFLGFEGGATEPSSGCPANGGCDISYGIGALLATLVVFPGLLGLASASRSATRRHGQRRGKVSG